MHFIGPKLWALAVDCPPHIQDIALPSKTKPFSAMMKEELWFFIGQ
jgi:hypothetical protein